MIHEYFPDRWVVVSLKVDGAIVYRILCSWFGGYLSSKEWKLSSGIVRIEEQSDMYLVYTASGSCYRCLKLNEGVSLLMAEIFNQIEKKHPEYVVKIVEIKDVKKVEN